MKIEPCYCFQSVDYEELLIDCETLLSKLPDLEYQAEDKKLSTQSLLQQIKFVLSQYNKNYQ